jgi:hypothetical protein
MVRSRPGLWSQYSTAGYRDRMDLAALPKYAMDALWGQSRRVVAGGRPGGDTPGVREPL